MKKPSPFVAGLLVLGGFVLAVVFGVNATHGFPLTSRQTVNAAFDDVGGLSVGDDVRVASVRVGFVEALRVEDGHALAVLKIDDSDMEFHGDATAVVVDRSALGQKFVNIDPGSKAAGDLDGTIALDQTTRAQDINQLLDTFDPDTREATGVTLRNVGGGMTGHAEDLNDLLDSAPGILTNTGKVSTALAADDGSALVNLMSSADTLAARFEGRQGDVADLVDQLATTVNAVAVDDGQPLQATIAAAPDTLDSLKSALDALRGPLAHTGSAMEKLRPGAAALGEATPDLRAFLREAVGPLRTLPKVNKQAEPALESLTDLVHDARPLARQLITTGDGAAPPVTVFGQYADEIVRYFVWGTETLRNEEPAGSYTRILVIPSDESLGGKPVSLMPVNRNPYPEPGQTDVGGN